LDEKEIVRIAMQAAAGLAAAHAQGLVHRDIKPANILLENGVERVKLTDFGLARTIDDASLTQSGVVAGTPQYMAPEQARGEAMDHRADLFSLGSVMYAMAAGHSPFRAETMMGVLRRICEDAPRPLREVNPDISEWLAEAIDRLLAKQPIERFQTAEELAERLGQYLAHLRQPTVSPRPAPLPKRRRSRPRLAIAVFAALSAVLLVGAAVWSGRGLLGARREHDPLQGAQQDKGQTASAASTSSHAEPHAERTGLSEWNRFDQELNAAWKQTDDLERRLGRSIGDEPRAPDPLTAIDGELDALEQNWSAGP
jgi:serine/threonine protein kinase